MIIHNETIVIAYVDCVCPSIQMSVLSISLRPKVNDITIDVIAYFVQVCCKLKCLS